MHKQLEKLKGINERKKRQEIVVGRLVRYFRKVNNLSIRDLEKLTTLSRGTISNIENGVGGIGPKSLKALGDIPL